MVLVRLLVLVVTFIVGLGIIRYAELMVRTFGHTDWAERVFGAGGSYTAWKLGGILVIICGFLYAVGTFEISPGQRLQPVPTTSPVNSSNVIQ